MDNLTHTLVGLALADSGLKRRSRFATATLVLGANLPDVDGLIYLMGRGSDALTFRRGWTHGVLAMVLLPLLLTALVLAWDRIVGRRRTAPPGAPVHPGWLVALAALGIWSHPLLDLLNVYGVRLLMPFSRRWFYGDTLFIIDPWVWAALAIGILVTRHRAARAGERDADPRRLTRAAIGAAIAYVLVMAALSRIGRGVVERQVPGPAALRTLVAPTFATPLTWDVIRDLGGRYELGRLSWELRPAYRPLGIVSAGRDEAGVRAASTTRAGAAFLEWARYPRFEAERGADGIRVTLSDVRYAGLTGRGWASLTVVVPAGAK
ncbi:MAG: metal-dependent hydrolase [Gemmatimonadota bacterium]